MDEPRIERRRRRGVLPFIGLSLLLHLQLVLVAVLGATLNPKGCSDVTRSPLPAFEVALVPGPEATEQARLQRLARTLREQERREEREERRIDGQVVDLPRPREEQRPDQAKYLSEYDSKVARQTKAPPRAAGAARRRPAAAAGGEVAPERGAGDPSAAPSTTTRPPPPLRLAMRPAAAPPRERTPAPALPPSRGPQLAPAANDGIDGRQEVQAAADAPAVTAAPAPAPAGGAVGAGQGPGEGLGRLMVSDEEMLRALGGGANDALSEVEEGEETLLNSRRWRYASFFNRVKQQVAQNWHPDRVYRRRDPTGNVYGFKDRLTVLVVTLDPQGGLREVKLEQPSGLAFLDDEAMTAFRLAQPFPNPPRGLVDDKSGRISFRFGFLFELTRQPSFRVFRYDDG